MSGSQVIPVRTHLSAVCVVLASPHPPGKQDVPCVVGTSCASVLVQLGGAIRGVRVPLWPAVAVSMPSLYDRSRVGQLQPEQSRLGGKHS